MSTVTDHAVVSDEMSLEQAHSMFEARSLDVLGISRLEFLARADAGEYDATDREDIISLMMLLPFAR